MNKGVILIVFALLVVGTIIVGVVVSGGQETEPQDPERGESPPESPAVSPFNPAQISLKEAGENLKELLDESLVFVDSGGVEWRAPKGTLTDGASVPRFALWVSDGRFDEQFLKAAVVHDAYCQGDNEGLTTYQSKPWQEVHRMFLDACLAGGTPRVKAYVMFAAVWLGGPRWRDPDADLSIVPDEVRLAGFNACREWIQNNSPTRDALEAWMNSREQTAIAVCRLESRAVAALRNENQAAANTAFQQSEQRLRGALRQSPDDMMLLNLQGYTHKDRAVAFRELNMEGRAAAELNEAERTFTAITREHPREPSAFKGLSSVELLRNDLDAAEANLRRAIEISPDYPAAREDLRRIEALRAEPPPR